MADVLRVVERLPGGLVRVEGLAGWWRLGRGPCRTCRGNLWHILLSRGQQRLTCARCVPPRLGEAVLRVVTIEEQAA